MAKRYGAAVIALTIDEDGMALTADKKVAIAQPHLTIWRRRNTASARSTLFSTR